jgi:hypothetical protein
MENLLRICLSRYVVAGLYHSIVPPAGIADGRRIGSDADLRDAETVLANLGGRVDDYTTQTTFDPATAPTVTPHLRQDARLPASRDLGAPRESTEAPHLSRRLGSTDHSAGPYQNQVVSKRLELTSWAVVFSRPSPHAAGWDFLERNRQAQLENELSAPRRSL